MGNCRIISSIRPEVAINFRDMTVGDFGYLRFDGEDESYLVLRAIDSDLVDLTDGGKWDVEDLGTDHYIVPLQPGQRVILEGV
jgi:hypothetical protein